MESHWRTKQVMLQGRGPRYGDSPNDWGSNDRHFIMLHQQSIVLHDATVWVVPNALCTCAIAAPRISFLTTYYQSRLVGLLGC